MRWHRLRRLLPLLVLTVVLILSWEELRTLDWQALRAALQRVPFTQLLVLQLAGLLAVAGMLSTTR